jgi:hypothetical protein
VVLSLLDYQLPKLFCHLSKILKANLISDVLLGYRNKKSTIMFLQILPPNQPTFIETVMENQTLLVVTGLAIGVFTVLKVVKFLSTLNVAKKTNKPSYS